MGIDKLKIYLYHVPEEDIKKLRKLQDKIKRKNLKEEEKEEIVEETKEKIEKYSKFWNELNYIHEFKENELFNKNKEEYLQIIDKLNKIAKEELEKGNLVRSAEFYNSLEAYRDMFEILDDIQKRENKKKNNYWIRNKNSLFRKFEKMNKKMLETEKIEDEVIKTLNIVGYLTNILNQEYRKLEKFSEEYKNKLVHNVSFYPELDKMGNFYKKNGIDLEIKYIDKNSEEKIKKQVNRLNYISHLMEIAMKDIASYITGNINEKESILKNLNYYFREILRK